MLEKTDNKTHGIYAMQYGTYLGLLWCAMYASFLAGFTSIFYTLCFFALYISSPFYAAYLTKKYRKEVCNDSMPFTQAWLFLFIMYICASLLSAVTQFIYFRFFDNGYFVQMIQQMFELLNATPEISNEMSKEFGNAIDLFAKLSSKDIVFNFLSSNMMNATILPPIIALFVKKNKQ